MTRIVCLLFALFTYLYSLYLLQKEEYVTIKEQILLCVAVIFGVSLHKYGSSFLLPYFFTQALSDSKEKKVYSLLNLFVILFSFIIRIPTFPEIIVVALICLFACLFKYGSGDVKCFVAVFLSLRQDTFSDSVFVFLIFWLIADLLFIIKGIAQKKSKKEKRAFFPSMFLSYVTMLVFLK